MIKCGSASTDCHAFEASQFHKHLDNGHMQHEDGNKQFVLFGDNAYMNTPYTSMPFTNVAGDPNCVTEDSYNFYHSQLRIRVECAFRMLVQIWGILRVAMPCKLTISKIVGMVNSLAKLRNFCIDEMDGRVSPTHDRDHFYKINNCHGYVSGNSNENSEEIMTPSYLVHGEHFDRIYRNILLLHQEEMMSIVLPRTYLLN